MFSQQHGRLHDGIIHPRRSGGPERRAVLTRFRFHQLTPPRSFFPFFLKIDVDNGDCDFLAAWLDAGLRPVFLDLELIHSYVPPEIQAALARKVKSEVVRL